MFFQSYFLFSFFSCGAVFWYCYRIEVANIFFFIFNNTLLTILNSLFYFYGLDFSLKFSVLFDSSCILSGEFLILQISSTLNVFSMLFLFLVDFIFYLSFIWAWLYG